MSAFLSPLRFEDDGGFPFTLTEHLVYVSDSLAELLEVPAQFKTDLASIPRPLWNVLPPVGKYDAAAVIHDYLYQTGLSVTRAAADGVLREAMEVLNVSRWQRWTIFLGVRAGGFRVWAKYRAAEKVQATA